MGKAKNQLVSRFNRNHSNMGLVLILALVCAVGLVFGSSLCWFFKDSSVEASCGLCECECSSETLFPIPLGFIKNNSYKDCGKHDPDTLKELEKDRATLLAEELELLKIVDDEDSKHTKSLLIDYGASYVMFKNEYEKCIIRIRTSEEARERTERELAREVRVTTIWEIRARELGWEE